ncbi:flavin-containing monooxygenase [Kribbella deserti]|uniref:Flavin-containing monooxygenase n=1 Tax=Kribbella deserti TaxID=1926257 RepID=A0ABV6QFC6_9ACTN
MTLRTDSVVIIGGGQSGLAGAQAARDAGLTPIVLEAGDRPVGSWPSYYDSLTLFSPARYSAFPGTPFPGAPDRYPSRDEVVAYLERYADGLGVEIRTKTRAVSVATEGDGLLVRTEAGDSIRAGAVIAASGSFTNPFVPAIPGAESFTGEVLHVAGYRDPKAYAGKQVVVVGAGNSAVQVAYELAEHAAVTLAVRAPVQFVPQVRGGKDLHFWLHALRVDLLPPSVLARLFSGKPVLDAGRYAEALAAGRFGQRPVFTAFTEDQVVWPDGERQRVDVVVFATGYRPNLPYLAGLGALTEDGLPLHRRGLSTTQPGLGFLGLEFQRSFSSNTLRGVHRDAKFVVKALARQLRRGR